MPASANLTVFALAAMVVVGAPLLAHAQGTEEQQQACTPDAIKLCSDAIPDIGKTTACMKSKFSQLTPRCQAAFNDATGGGKGPKATTKTAVRKAEPPGAKMATREARPMPEREAPETRTASRAPHPLPERETSDATTPMPAAGFPPFPSPDRPVVQAAASGTARSQIANACRAGLIDSFTCSTTVPALLGGPAY